MVSPMPRPFLLLAFTLALGAQAPKKPVPPAPAAAPSPDELAADLHLVKAKQHLDAGRFREAAEEMDAIVRLGDRVRIPTDFHYHYARCLVGARRFDEGLAAARRYIELAGRGGAFYAKALEILASADEQKAAYLQDLVTRCQARAQEVSFRLSGSYYDRNLGKSFPCLSELRLAVTPEGIFTLELRDRSDFIDARYSLRFPARELVAARASHFGHDTVWGHVDNLASLDLLLARPALSTVDLGSNPHTEPRLFHRFFLDNLFKGTLPGLRERIEAVVAFLGDEGLELARAQGGSRELLAPAVPDERIQRLLEALPAETYRGSAEGSRGNLLGMLIGSLDDNPNEQAYLARLRKLAR